MDSLLAKANTGTGTDTLAGKSTAAGFVGAALLTDGSGTEIAAANPLPVAIYGSTPANAAVDMPGTNTPALPIRQAPQKYTDISFSQVGSGLIAPEMQQIAAGTGMTISQSAGNLVIATGTTANAEFIARSVQSFNGALTLKQVTTLSQRIANNNFFVELVDVIGDGLAYTIVNTTTVGVTKVGHGFTAQNVGQRMDICALSSVGIPMEGVIASIPNADTIRFTVAGWPASGSGTCSLTGWNKFEILYSGVTATVVSLNTRRKGWQNTASTPTVVNSASAHMLSLNVDNGVITLSDKAGTAGAVLTNRSGWDTNVPQPDINLYLQVRAKNGSTAPATTTTWTVGMVRVEDYIPTQVAIASVRQQSNQQSIPVLHTGTIVAVLQTGNSRAGFLAGAGIWWDDSSTTLAASATFTGTSRDLINTATATAFSTPTVYASEFRALAESDVTGTLWLEASRDNVTWRRVKSVDTTAVAGGGFVAELYYRPAWRYARAGFTNGAGAQARFTLGSVAMASV